MRTTIRSLDEVLYRPLKARAAGLRVLLRPVFEALETFRSQGEGGLSFADAAIVTVARRHAPGYVASFDRDLRGVAGLSLVPEQRSAS